MDTITLDYYNSHANAFTRDTQGIAFTEMQDRFLAQLPSGSCILDFGCGAGRDTKYFLGKGYNVTAIDGSYELCTIASEFTGIQVKQMLFEELDDIDLYDGIWACSSILHLPKADLKDVFVRISNALKDQGILYTSFKYGDFSGMRNGRFFTDFTLESFTEFIKQVPTLQILTSWTTGDVRKGRENEKWLNLFLQKI